MSAAIVAPAVVVQRTPGMGRKPVRVDNWGNFLAQRIEGLYDKQEHCDLTLRFPGGDLKAHSLILHVCTPFFTTLLKGKTTGHKILKMPPQISSTTMAIILRFVYTGRLEASCDMEQLYNTAKLLKLQILIRLLEAQRHGGDNAAETGRARDTAVAMALAGRTLGRPAGSPRGRHSGVYQPTNSQMASKRSIVRAAEPPADARPSRFEFPDTDDLEMQQRLPVMDTALASRRPAAAATPAAPPAPHPPPPAPPRPADREAAFETLRQTPVKRPAPQENGDQKRARTDADAGEATQDVTTLREYYQEQRRRAQLLGEQDGADEDVDEPAPVEADWNDEEPPPPPADIKSLPAADSAILTASDIATHATAGTPTTPAAPGTPATPGTPVTPGVTATLGTPDAPANAVTPATPRPILKQEPGSGGSVKKRVQFSESSQLTVTVQDLGDTSELVSQLIKQHPDVLRAGQNVKVRLVTPGGGASRTEYVVVKQQQQLLDQPSAGETLDSPLSCSLCARAGRQVDFWWADQMSKHFQDVHSDAAAIDLNTLSCTTCEQAGDPIEFAAVDDYFTHLRDVHETRGVSGIGSCHLCGYSAQRKLQLLYHQYTRHQIRPPRFITFPKCDRCDYEAITESELTRHRQRNHRVAKEYKCKECGVMVSSLSLLEAHMRSKACRQMSDPKRRIDQWNCQYCGMSFSRSYNLKGHMRSVHKVSSDPRRVTKSEVKEEPAAATEEATPPPPAAAPAQLDPSSEAESMSAVANSVAASLSLAVDGEYMALSDGIVPVEDENGLISYIALRPAAGAAADAAVVEMTQYTVPVVVGGGVAGDTVTIQVGQTAGPGGSAGQTVLPDLQSTGHLLTRAAPLAVQADGSISLPATTASQAGLNVVTVPHLVAPSGQWASRRRGQPAGLVSSSRITVSSSQFSDDSQPDLPLELQHGEELIGPDLPEHHIYHGQSGDEAVVYSQVGVPDMQHGQGMDMSHVHACSAPRAGVDTEHGHNAHDSGEGTSAQADDEFQPEEVLGIESSLDVGMAGRSAHHNSQMSDLSQSEATATEELQLGRENQELDMSDCEAAQEAGTSYHQTDQVNMLEHQTDQLSMPEHQADQLSISEHRTAQVSVSEHQTDQVSTSEYQTEQCQHVQQVVSMSDHQAGHVGMLDHQANQEVNTTGHQTDQVCMADETDKEVSMSDDHHADHVDMSGHQADQVCSSGHVMESESNMPEQRVEQKTSPSYHQTEQEIIPEHQSQQEENDAGQELVVSDDHSEHEISTSEYQTEQLVTLDHQSEQEVSTTEYQGEQGLIVSDHQSEQEISTTEYQAGHELVVSDHQSEQEISTTEYQTEQLVVADQQSEHELSTTEYQEEESVVPDDQLEREIETNAYQVGQLVAADHHSEQEISSIGHKAEQELAVCHPPSEQVDSAEYEAEPELVASDHRSELDVSMSEHQEEHEQVVSDRQSEHEIGTSVHHEEHELVAPDHQPEQISTIDHRSEQELVVYGQPELEALEGRSCGTPKPTGHGESVDASVPGPSSSNGAACGERAEPGPEPGQTDVAGPEGDGAPHLELVTEAGESCAAVHVDAVPMEVDSDRRLEVDSGRQPVQADSDRQGVGADCAAGQAAALQCGGDHQVYVGEAMSDSVGRVAPDPGDDWEAVMPAVDPTDTARLDG